MGALEASPARRTQGFLIVLEQEARDLWLGGRGLLLAFAFAVLLGVIAYLVATNQALNFLEQRESVGLVLQVTIAVGALLALLVAADAVSGERERGTLETLLASPVSRAGIGAGKLAAALTLWLAAFAIAVPHVIFLGHGVGIVGSALLSGFLVGTLVAGALAAVGLLVSVVAASNRVSLSVSLFVLLALFAPTQLPTGAQQGFVGELLLRVNPMTAGSHYVDRVVVGGHGFTQDASWLVAPLVAAAVLVPAAVIVARGVRLSGGRA